jgi:hypothetical protein
MIHRTTMIAILMLFAASCTGLQQQRRQEAMQDYQELSERAAANREAEQEAREDRQAEREARHADEQERKHQWEAGQEKIRAANSGAYAKKVAEQRAKRNAEKVELLADAKKLGYKGVIFDASLTLAVRTLLGGELTLKDLAGKVIELDYEEDSKIVALQVLGKGRALFTSRRLKKVVLMLKKYDETILEGASLRSLNTSYFLITGTTTYSTTLGRRQAIVIEPSKL